MADTAAALAAVGFIGFGEVARTLSARILSRGGTVTVCVVPHPGQRPIGAPDSVTVAGQLAELDRCELIMSVVTPASALDVAKAYRSVAVSGQVYLDLNSSSPAVKQEIEQTFDGTGVEVVDIAIVGRGVSLEGADVPLLVSGSRSRLVAERLTSLGLNAEAVDAPVGASAALKMLRGVVIKGLAAALVEAMLAARVLNIEDQLLTSVSAAIGPEQTRRFIEMLLETHGTHHGRRASEAAYAAEFVASLGIDPIMSRAMTQALERVLSGPAESAD